MGLRPGLMVPRSDEIGLPDQIQLGDFVLSRLFRDLVCSMSFRSDVLVDAAHAVVSDQV